MIKVSWQFLIFSGLLLAFCSVCNVAAQEKIIIGVATSLSAPEGRESLNAVLLAADEINTKGGVNVCGKKIPLSIESVSLRGDFSDGSVSDALQDLEKIIVEKKVHAIVVGPFRSEVFLTGMDVIAKYKVPMLETIALSPTPEAKIMRYPKYKYIFRLCLNSKYLVEYLISTMKFMNKKFGFDKVYIMSQDAAWARTTVSLMIKLFFAKAGWKIVGMDNYPRGSSDFTAGLKKASDRGAQILLTIFDTRGSATLVRQWHTMQVPAFLCGYLPMMNSPGAWQSFDGKIAGTLNVVFEIGNVPSAKYMPATDFYEAYSFRHYRKGFYLCGKSDSANARHLCCDALCHHFYPSHLDSNTPFSVRRMRKIRLG
ncbi:ABC transporter substrate-binding protein [Desulfonema magnum]|nr:ABC transporter substrate-binding protein [Desulfonema magnum]